MDYSEFTLLEPPKNTRSNCTSVTRTGQRTPPIVCCWDSASPHTLRSCFGSLSLAKAPTRAHALRAMPGRLFLFYASRCVRSKSVRSKAEFALEIQSSAFDLTHLEQE